jgi:ligand-binding sensor domain-containing protein/signal transduction histidine kinase
MKVCLKTLLLLLLPVLFYSQQNLRFEYIGMEDGLSNENVLDIMQDSKGYIWIGTMDGLNKYDGYTFTKYRFDPTDSNSLSQNLIYTIWEDKQGFIWVGTFEGLCRFDRHTEKFTRYKPDPKDPFSDPNICAISEDNAGMMWVGSASGGLCRFDKQAGRFLPENFFPKRPGDKESLHGAVKSIYNDTTGTLWIGTLNGIYEAIFSIPKAGKPAEVELKKHPHNPFDETSISNDSIGSIFKDRSGLFWIGTANGLNSFDWKTGRFKRYLHDPGNINSISTNMTGAGFGTNICEDKDDNLWIATMNGVNKLNKERNSFTRFFYSADNSLSISSTYGIRSNAITTLSIDNAGILWVGTWDGKLSKANLNQKPFGLINYDPTNRNSLSNNNVLAILEDSSGILWIGTSGGGLSRWDKKTNNFRHFNYNAANNKTLRSDYVYGLLEDKHGHLWICNGSTLSRLNKHTGEFRHYNSNEKNFKDFDHQTIYSITQDSDGDIWLGTGNGIKQFNENTGLFTHYYHTDGDTSTISDYTSIAIYADSKNNMWSGFGSIATDRLDKKTGRITHYKHIPEDPESISSNIVNCFYEYPRGIIWMGTSGGGLCRFDYSTGKFTTYTIKDGLPDNSVYSVLADNDSHLWLGTGNGLSQFDPVKKTFTNYEFKDGLQSNVFGAGWRNRPARYKGRDGVLYFGGPGGFNFFDPSQLKTDTTLAPVVITQFKLFDELVKGANEAEKIILKHNENYFSFEFSSLSYYNPVKNKYAYMLEGVDKGWVNSGTRRYAGYTDIGPGKYIFRVKATNNDGVWNEEGASIVVIIRPPWWRTWWAYGIYALMVIAALFAIHNYQKQRVIRAEREKIQKKELEQAKEIEKAYQELKTTQQQLIHSEKMASLGELTAGIAHEIQNPLNFVNNFSEVNDELLKELKTEAEKGNLEEVKAIAKDIELNSEKINHHGKRADAIVKGMLQHSRTSTGQKEPTDVNALAEEYLRLAYHGLRAKDQSFNANFKTDFDNSIGKINIVPQEIGRVILNLINNAFYAVDEKKKSMPPSPKGEKGAASFDYEPVVTVTTKRLVSPPAGGDRGKIEIRVADNGNGVPQKVLDKIFQPFFTTKPTGQGTGLGLSLSYDIVKAHGGELKVETKEGGGSEFTIQLPISKI